MRNLCLALILANLAVAAWTGWFAAEPDGTTMQGGAKDGSLTLVSEVAEPSPSAVAAAGDAPGAADEAPALPSVRAVSQDRCVSLGPFRELAQAATAAANLRSTGLKPTQRVAEGDIWVGYWVHLPDFPTRQAADTVLSRLRANGVSDSYIVPGGDSSHTISLGLWNGQGSKSGILFRQIGINGNRN